MEEKHILDEDMFNNLKQMLLSDIDDNITLALGIIKNIDRNSSEIDKMVSELLEIFWSLDSSKIHKYLKFYLEISKENQS